MKNIFLSIYLAVNIICIIGAIGFILHEFFEYSENFKTALGDLLWSPLSTLFFINNGIFLFCMLVYFIHKIIS